MSLHLCARVLVCACAPLPFQLQLSCWGLLLVAIMGVFVCVYVCVSGWSSPVSLLLIVLYCSALTVPEGRRGLGQDGVGDTLGWLVLQGV